MVKGRVVTGTKGIITGNGFRAVLAAAMALLGASGAFAVPSDAPREETWVTNGKVSAIVTTPTTTYIGGSFTWVGPYMGNGVPIDTGTGAPVAIYPKVVGIVRACVPDGTGGWYIGGDFTRVGTVLRNYIAHILVDGTVDPLWNSNANGGVYALAVDGSTIYAGGGFTGIGGQMRNRIAALNATTGAATAWNPNASSSVRALAVSGTTVYAGGEFTSVGGQTRRRIAALDATTGLATDWNPNANNEVSALAVSGTTVYAGGWFDSIGGQTRSRIAALDATTGLATTWNPSATGDMSPFVYALAVSGSTVYAGGAFTTIGGQPRNSIAALDATTGTATPWNPDANLWVSALAVSGTTVYAGGAFTTIGGQPRKNIAALDAATGTATAWNPNASDGVFALAVDGSTVYAGGNFISIGGHRRNRIAALDATTGALTVWNPDANNPVSALAVDGSTVYAGGYFTNIGGQTRNNIAALDATTGAATAWNPNANTQINALAVSGTMVYAGGDFWSIGGQTRNYIAALDTATGALTSWNPNASYSVSALAVSGSTVYAGGDFWSIDGQTRNNIAALDATTGTATAWNPNANNYITALAISGTTLYTGGAFTGIGGKTRGRIAALSTTTGLATAWNPNANNIVFALAVSGTTVYAGGWFTTIGGQTRNRIAALDATTGLATAWNPNANTGITVLAVSGTTVYAGGDFTTIGGVRRPYLAEFRDVTAAPSAPGNPGATAIGTSTITWTWTDNSGDESGFKVYDDSGADPPATLQTTTPAGITAYTQTALAVNTQYAFQVAATNVIGDSALTPNFTAWTLAATPTAPTVNTPTGSSLDLSIGAGDGNPAGTEYALRCATTSQWVQADGSLGAAPVWQTAAVWGTATVTGLAEHTSYAFTATARNGAGTLTAAGPEASGMTLDVTPPTVLISLATPSPTASDTVVFTVDFSEPLGAAFDETMVTVAGSLAGTAVVTGTDPNYTVTVTPTDPDANGTVGIEIAAGAVADLAGKPCAGGVSALCDLYNWPGFGLQPQGATLYTGSGHLLEVQVAGGGVPTTYQWWHDNGAKTMTDGPAAAQWALSGVTAANAGEYWCLVTFDGVPYESNHVQVSVAADLAITADPADQTVTERLSAIFTVVTTGGHAPLHYQWKKDGDNLSDGTDGPILVISSVTTDDAGDYSVEVYDSHTASVESTTATLTVEPGASVAGGLGLAALALAAALGGMRTLRRR